MGKSIFAICCALLAVVLTLAACGGEQTPAQQVAIQGLDIKFNVNTLTVKAGQPVELTYENRGVIDHAFKIDGVTKEVKIRPGESNVIKFTLEKAGDYKFVCAMPGHEMAGMVGTLQAIQ